MRYAAKWPHIQKISWLKRLGVVGFTFFLGKGLLWLGILAAAWWLG